MKIIKLLPLAIIPILIMVLFGSVTTMTDAQNPSLSKTYSNELCGLSINYPDNWIVEESNSKFEEGQTSLVSMAELMPNTPEGFKSTMQLDGEAISAYRDKSIKGIAEFMEFYHSNPGVTIVQSTGTAVQGLPAHQIVYEETSPSGEIWKTKETYIPSENTLYVIRYFTIGSEYYDKYISIVNNMIQSIKVDGRAC